MPRSISAPTPYASQVAARLRELRLSAGCWSMRDLQQRLAALGRDIPTPTLYAYERGKAGGRVDLPIELAPLMSAVFGFERPGDWLPQR